MSFELTDSQKQALEGYRNHCPATADVRTWPFQNRMDLLFGNDLITIFMEAETLYGSVCSELLVLPKWSLAAVSPTFADHLLQKPDLESFIFDVGRMDKTLQEEHRKAIETMEEWLWSLSTPQMFDLRAPTFFSEISLRHIARQLGMSFYLTDRTDEFIRDAQKHTLQPWQVTELLYASSIEADAAFPIVMENDPLLRYLAREMMEKTDSMWGEERDQLFSWLRNKENNALLHAMQRMHEERQNNVA